MKCLLGWWGGLIFYGFQERIGEKPLIILDTGFASHANLARLKERGYSHIVNNRTRLANDPPPARHPQSRHHPTPARRRPHDQHPQFQPARRRAKRRLPNALYRLEISLPSPKTEIPAGRDCSVFGTSPQVLYGFPLTHEKLGLNVFDNSSPCDNHLSENCFLIPREDQTSHQ